MKTTTIVIVIVIAVTVGVLCLISHYFRKYHLPSWSNLMGIFCNEEQWILIQDGLIDTVDAQRCHLQFKNKQLVQEAHGEVKRYTYTIDKESIGK